MEKRTRNFLFLFFSLTFFVVTFFLIVYAQGYKLNLSWPIKANLLFQKTGILILDTEPKGARIFINGEPKGTFSNVWRTDNVYAVTPMKIKNIMPGEYTIRLELDNYWPWEKKLEIKPGESTYAEDIILFKNELPQLLIPEAREIFAWHNGQLLVYTESGPVKFNLQNEIAEILASSTPGSLLPSPFGNDYLIQTEGSAIFFSGAKENTPINLFELCGRGLSNFRWFEEEPGLIYYQAKNSLGWFNIKNKSCQIFYNLPGLLDFLIKKDEIYALVETENSCELLILNKKNPEQASKLNLPCSQNLNFINPEHDYLNILDSKHRVLYIVDPAAKLNNIKNIIPEVKKTSWITDDKILYANDFEIWTYDGDSNEKDLITRISDAITDIIWHPNENYIIYSTEKTINVIELDNREKRIVTKLVELDNIKNLHLSKDGKTLYFIATIGSRSGLYKLYLK